jgi:hypothetical protein
MPYGTVNADLITTSDGVSSAGLYGLKNRIFNGDMRIDQRNAGASVTVNTATDTYGVDRWLGAGVVTDGAFTMQQDSNAPTGFSNSLKITVTTADASITGSQSYQIQQKIEGFNTSDLGFGTASAATVTLSFWVRSSLTGTFGGALVNSAFNRSYPFSYTISAANTWEQKSVTIAGDTSGTWIGSTNGIGLRVYFGLGAADRAGTAGAWAGAGYVTATGAVSVIGTLNATFYITGVQLEKGSTATSFDYRPYGTELSLCQRYYFKIQATGDVYPFGTGYNSGTTTALGYTPFPVPLRANPTAFEQSGTASHYKVRHGTTETVCSAIPSAVTSSQYSGNTTFTVASGLTAGQGSMLWSGSASAYLAWSAEL